MTAVKYFDGRETGNSGLYIQPCDTIFINAYLDDIDQKKVLYHELGHVGQYLENYDLFKEKLEIQADRRMIRKLLIEHLRELDDYKMFNLSRFMEIYRFKTLSEEQIIIEEFKKLI